MACQPLIRRKCSTIVYVDSEPERDPSGMAGSIQLALEELGATFLAQETLHGKTEFLPLDRALQDFYLPRCVLDLPALARLKASHENKEVAAVWEELRGFCENAYAELNPLLDHLPGATHIKQSARRKDLIYVYFEDEVIRSSTMARIGQERRGLLDYGATEAKVPAALRSAPCCTLVGSCIYLGPKDIQENFPKVLSKAWRQSAQKPSSFSKLQNSFSEQAAGVAWHLEQMSKKSNHPLDQKDLVPPTQLVLKHEAYSKVTFATEQQAQHVAKFLEKQHLEQPILVSILVTAEARAAQHSAEPDSDSGWPGEKPSIFGNNSQHFMSEINTLATDFKAHIESVNIATCWSMGRDDNSPHGNYLPIVKIKVH